MRRRAGLPAVVLAGGLALPLAVGTGLSVLAVLRSPLESDTQPQALVATVGHADRLDSQATTVTYAPSDTYAVKSQSSGTVTALRITPGTPVADGSAAMTVDGHDVIAYVASAPLFRDVGARMEGPDVLTAQRVLATAGLLTRADGKVGTDTVRAIRAFNERSGLGDSATLSVGSLLWIPEGSGPPQTVEVRVGDVLSPQADLYTTSANGDRITVATDIAAEDRTVTVGAARVTLAAGTTAISEPDDVAAIRAAMAQADTAPATLTATAPRPVGTVPASAVVVDQQGRACYFTGVTGPSVPIAADKGSFGLVDVDPELVGSPVLTDPRRSRADLTCG